LTFFGQPLGLAAAQKFVLAFDKDRSGQISFDEYIAMHVFINAVGNAFIQNDRDRSQTLDFNEIQGALGSTGFFQQLPPPVIVALLQKVDKTGRAQLSYNDFMFVAAHLAFVRSVFEWNDPARTGRINLGFDQFAHLSTEFVATGM
jgi:peflin